MRLKFILSLYFFLFSAHIQAADCLDPWGYLGNWVGEKCERQGANPNGTEASKKLCQIGQLCNPLIVGAPICAENFEGCLKDKQPIGKIQKFIADQNLADEMDILFQEMQIICDVDFGDPRNQTYCPDFKKQMKELTYVPESEKENNVSPVKVDDEGNIDMTGNFSGKEKSFLEFAQDFIGQDSLEVKLGEHVDEKPTDTFERKEETPAEVAKEEVPVSCKDSLQAYFSKDIPPETLDKFLKLQSELTLNKMAWAHLNLMKEGGAEKRVGIEINILKLLKEKYSSSQDDTFKKAVDEFETAPLSREALANVAPYLKDFLPAQTGDELFNLNSSDVKILHLLSAKEKSSHFSSDRSKNSSVLHMSKIINSSYNTIQLDPKNIGQVEKNQKVIEQEIEKNLTALDKIISQLPKELGCNDEVMDIVCSDSEMSGAARADFLLEMEDVVNGIYEGILKSEQDIYNKLKFGDAWLKVKR
ncbi:MAG: hypothetical protein JNM93_14140 [Bacteriovoracaceae bacterium]|nr:hypothetical protein [Bacteriovoracaceae bacterium]